MLHLQKLLFLVRSPASPVHSSLHRALLSSAAVGASPVHFAAEDYLVDTCGLTKEQAAKAAKHIAHCKSPCNANAVLSFLASPALGLSKAEIAHFIAQDARILNFSVLPFPSCTLAGDCPIVSVSGDGGGAGMHRWHIGHNYGGRRRCMSHEEGSRHRVPTHPLLVTTATHPH